MASNPSAEVLLQLRAAAEQTGVPLSLLWGVAFAESGFDPSKDSGKAKGLMQLSPQICATYGVTDPFDARQSALAGAKLLARLGKALQWNLDAMLSAYVWGPTAYAKARAQGAKIPAEVTTYVRRALAARDVYRAKADRPHGSITQALNIAIEALAKLNPTWPPASMVRDAWRSFFARRGGDSDAAALLNPDLAAQWHGYAAAYERAPITDESTPLPELLRPDLWRAAADKIDRTVHALEDVAENTAIGLGAGVFAVLLFWWFASNKRR
jgi:hypothetical protein